MSRFKKSMFSNKRFLSLLSGQGVSYFGDSIASVALPILILTVTGSGFLMGLVGALEVAPLFIVGLPAGVWVDRWNRSRVMLLSDFGRAVLMALIPIASWVHIPVMPVVVFVAIMSGTLAVFFGAAYTGMIPRIVAPEQLGRANGYFEAIESAAYAFGPSLAGILTSKIGPSNTIGLDALSFVFSALSIISLRDNEKETKQSSSQDFFAEMRVGLKTVVQDSVLKAITLLWGSNRFVFAALIPTLTFFVLKTLHGGAEQVGVSVSIYALGSLLGTLVGSRIPERLGMVTAMSAQSLMFVGAILLSRTNWVPMVFGCSAILGLGEGLLLVIYLTYRVSRVSEDVVGRVYTITSTATQGMGAIGYLVIGSLLSIWGGHITWIVLSVLSILGIASSLLVLKKKLIVRQNIE
ncbi:MFS transporter [Alicyclobacillus acidoterrestris]|nr:MFS transporter [Alicyclobacillus acidoterrestris]